MANYMANTRTNYFRVTDEDAYAKLFDSLTSEDDIEDFTETKNNITYHGFGAYGCIESYDEDEEEYDMDEWYEKLQKILPDDEAFILLESGHEKLRYIVGAATIVTNKDIKYLNIGNLAVNAAKEMLHDPDFTTQIDY